MVTWVRKTAESNDENHLITGLIVSDVFIAKMQDLYKPEFIVNDSLKTIGMWCMNYYKQFGQAPKQHIQDIFEEKRFGLDKANAELIKEFLILLNNQYLDFEGPINDDYFLSRAKKYFTLQNLKVRASRTLQMIDIGKIEDAEAEISEYKQFNIAASRAISPSDPDLIRRIMEKKETAFFKYPGPLGELLGPIERGYLVGILGIFKRGKTAFMINTATLAAFSRLKVVYATLEMQDIGVAERMIRNIGTFTKEKDRLFPCFDCYKNQTGTCNLNVRTNSVVLFHKGNPKPKYYNAPTGYLPCDYCRLTDVKEYHLSTWFEKLDYPDISQVGMTNKMKSFEKMCGDNIRMLTYARFTANIRDIEHDLSLLEEKEMFIPDMILIDYAGIIKPEDSREDRIHQIDTTWKRLAQLASERNCIVITATQGTRGAIKKRNTDSTDVAEWIGILGHVDLMVTLNQTPEEKESKVLRIGVIASRHEDYNEYKNAVLLTNFGAAQAFADSFIVNVNDDE